MNVSDNPNIEIYTMDDCIDEMREDLVKGKEKGTSTYIAGGQGDNSWSLDNAWTWKLKEFNLWTGYTNEGKSQFIRYMSLIKAIVEGWKFAFYAPEDYPPKEFFDDLIHTASGYSTDKDNPNFIRRELYDQMYNRLKDLFYFVYIHPPKNTLNTVLKSFIPLIEEKGVKACIIDPLIKISRPPEYMNADDKYALHVTTLATHFSRKHNISLHLVMHQLGGKKQENGLFSKPSYYGIKGGGTWADGSDNVLEIWRPLYARDKEDTEVMFIADKIKKQKLVGVPQDIKIRFDPRTNRYVDWESKLDLFPFDEHLRVPRMKLMF